MCSFNCDDCDWIISIILETMFKERFDFLLFMNTFETWIRKIESNAWKISQETNGIDWLCWRRKNDKYRKLFKIFIVVWRRRRWRSSSIYLRSGSLVFDWLMTLMLVISTLVTSFKTKRATDRFKKRHQHLKLSPTLCRQHHNVTILSCCHSFIGVSFDDLNLVIISDF